MAKSKKSKKKSALTYIKYGAVLLGIVGAIMTVLGFVNYGDSSFSGINVIFGYTGTLSGFVSISKQILSFSIMALLAVLLPLAGSFSVLFKNKIIRLVGALMMIAGAVLCFLMPNFIVFVDSATASIFSLANASLGIGAILAGVFFGIGALCNLYAVIEK